MVRGVLAMDRSGVGSFLEAMLAMMVISSALCLLMVQLPLLAPVADPAEALMAEANDLLERTLRLLEGPDGLVREAQLASFEPKELSLARAQGCKVEVRPMCVDGPGPPTRLLHLSGPVPDRLDSCAAVDAPISLDLGGGRVQAAVLSVVVW
jgi:hypothetical protein